MAAIGKRNTLTVLRDSASGLYLDGGEHGAILLPNRYVLRGLAQGDRLEVLGYKVLVEGVHPGLLYQESISGPVAIGQKLKGFVRTVRPDGKLDLSLDEAGYQRVAPLAQRIIEALQRNGGRLELDDNSPPTTIRQALGTSKKAFKQALGTLYKARRIRFSKPGIALLDNSTWAPGSPPPAKQNG